jgi:hypothetical protein
MRATPSNEPLSFVQLPRWHEGQRVDVGPPESPLNHGVSQLSTKPRNCVSTRVTARQRHAQCSRDIANDLVSHAAPHIVLVLVAEDLGPELSIQDLARRNARKHCNLFPCESSNEAEEAEPGWVQPRRLRCVRVRRQWVDVHSMASDCSSQHLHNSPCRDPFPVSRIPTKEIDLSSVLVWFLVAEVEQPGHGRRKADHELLHLGIRDA